MTEKAISRRKPENEICDSTMQFRIPGHEKIAFLNACEALDVSHVKLLRSFMRKIAAANITDREVAL